MLDMSEKVRCPNCGYRNQLCEFDMYEDSIVTYQVFYDEYGNVFDYEQVGAHAGVGERRVYCPHCRQKIEED